MLFNENSQERQEKANMNNEDKDKDISIKIKLYKSPQARRQDPTQPGMVPTQGLVCNISSQKLGQSPKITDENFGDKKTSYR